MEIRCRYDQLIPVHELKPHPKNRNQHPKEQIERLAKILEYQGWRHPIKVSARSGYITAGHGRLEAAKHLGWDSVPVEVQEYIDETQEIADITSDNAIALWAELDLSGINYDVTDLGPDFDIDLLGIKDFVLEPVEKLEPKCDEDEVPDALPEPKVVQGELYILGNHRLMCGDSTSITDVERLTNNEQAEICFTSPPYADQREYNDAKNLDTAHISTFIRAAYGKVSFFVVNLGYARKNGEVYAYWDEYIREARDCGLKLLSWNIWDKGECGSIGNQTAMFGISHEWLFVFGSEAKELNRTIENNYANHKANHSSSRQKNGSLKKNKNRIILSHSQLKTIYQCTSQKARDDIDHPARFPVEFPQGYIEAMTDVNNLIYEPFAGSGSTLIACEKTYRRCNAMELDPSYCEIILDRWQKFTGQKAHREDGVAWDDIKSQSTLKP